MSQATLDALDFFIPANNLGYVNLSEGTVGAIGYVQVPPLCSCGDGDS